MYTNTKTEAVNLSITIEHDKRKREILEKALDVFIDEGYEDTTFQKIAERCGITRTILYLYFKNKREIFTFSIKLSWKSSRPKSAWSRPIPRGASPTSSLAS